MNILITGGTGFLGSHTAKALSNLGHNVTVVGRSEKNLSFLKEHGINFSKLDITKREQIDRAISKVDIVIHCAALASPFGRYKQFKKINVDGTQNVVDSCLKYKVKKLVNISTPSLYFDYSDKLQIKESDLLPKKQVSFYGETKRLADIIVTKAYKESNLNCITLRPRAIFGIGDQTITPRILDSKIAGRAPLINGGNAIQDLTYIDNVVDAIILAINSGPEISGKVYNITNGEPLKIKEVFSIFHQAFNKDLKTIHINYRLIHSVATIVETIFKVLNLKKEPKITKLGIGLFGHSQTLDISLAKKELGYSPKISISEGIRIVAEAKRS